jgi:hypothetical protein
VRRRLIAAAAGCAGALACASASPPPGGPEDHAPPRLVRITPDTNAVNVRDGTVRFYFDETINDRGAGAQEVGRHFLISPSDGSARVNWHRSRIDVRPHDGFKPNTAYSVSLLPGLADLRGNAMKTGATVVFSTGPTIPIGRITGIVFDWAAERPAALALIQALTPDSVLYLAQSDTSGHFTVGPLGPGRYLVRAIVDANANRALDRNEAFDSSTVVVPQAAPLELRTAQRDTLPPRLLSVTASDSITLHVEFDRALDPTQTLALADFRLVRADSSVVPIASVQSPHEAQLQEEARRQARMDSSRHADSVAGKVLPPLPRPAPPAKAAPPKPSVPAPFNSLVIHTATPLAPSASYRLSVRNLRGLTGRTQASDRSFTTPKPPPPPPPPAAVRRDSLHATTAPPAKRP